MNTTVRAFASLAFACIICDCSGSVNPVVGAGAIENTSGSSVTVAVSMRSTKTQLPTAGQVGGSVIFPSVAANATLTVTSSTVEPAGFASSQSILRRPQSGTLSIFYYLTIVPNTTITFSSLPSFELLLPSTFRTVNQQFYYAISQPPATGVSLQFLTEGPGSVTGPVVAFPASLTSLTLGAGKRYIFGFYALSANNTSADNVLYVANAGANSITSYALSAQGNVAPKRTISGPATGLFKPSAIAVDSDGNLIVANALAGGSGVVEIFPEGSVGNARPSRTFAISGQPEAIVVDPFDASIYIGIVSQSTYVGVFTPTGIPLRTISNFGGVSTAFVAGLAVDKNDELIVGAAVNFSDHGAFGISTFAPQAGGNDAPIHNDFSIPGFTGPAYAGKTDHVFEAQPLTEFTNHAFSIVRQSVGSISDGFEHPLAVDPLGQNIYAVGSPDTVYHYTQDSANGFVRNAPIAGSSTGLSQPSGLAVGIP